MPEKTYIINDICLPIQVGYDETHIDMGIQKDSDGDNISLKHPAYSEYTALYWMWKNVDSEYKGFFHHRRAMTTESVPFKSSLKGNAKLLANQVYNLYRNHITTYHAQVECMTNEEYQKKLNVFLNDLAGLLNHYDVLVPQRFEFSGFSVGELFDEVVNRYILKCMREILKSDYVDYAVSFEECFKASRMYYAEISVMKNEVFDKYCTFLFGVLEKLESKLIEEKYYIDPIHEQSMFRVFGYTGELLHNVFIYKYGKDGGKVKELSLLFNAAAKGNESIDFKTMQYKEVLARRFQLHV